MMITPAKTALSTITLLGLALVLAACPASLDDRCAEGACEPRAGEAGGGDVVDSGSDAPLDPCVNTPTDPKCLDESTALFVSAAAPDAGADGTRAHPFKTIGAGLAAVTATRKRIYVCEGDYAESVTVKTAVSILGGLACDWSGKGANPRIAPAKGVGLTIAKADGVVVADVDVDGNADAQLPGDSAIAVFVSESKGVLFRRANLKAGDGTSAGAPGADGDTSPNYVGALAPSGLNTGTTAAAEAPACGACADGSLSTGGKGAASGGVPAAGTASPAVGVDNSGASGGVCSDGKPGAAGTAGPAAVGADRPGTAKAGGWDVTVVAQKGANGNPAQGGGGAGSTAALGGGSGGCGGCGGTGGAPGSNGGSSFALLTFESDVTVETSTLTAAAGGAGSAGGKGQDAQLRGGPGNGACLAGVGGYGAGGGGGGGGAGGHSAAIAHVGKAPTATGATLKAGSGGAFGGGGAAGASSGNPGAPGSPGVKGSSAEVLPL
jgi:hypothetical protein